MSTDQLLGVVLSLIVLGFIAERLSRLLQNIIWIKRKRNSSKDYGIFITNLNMVVGTAIAFLMRINVFEMFRTPDTSRWFGWMGAEWTWYIFFEILLTGVAISFVSIMWYYLTDRLFHRKRQVKDLDAIISSKIPEREKLIQILESEERIPFETIKQAITENSDMWFKKYPGVVGISVGMKHTDGLRTYQNCITFEVKYKDANLPKDKMIPKEIKYITSDKQSVMIPTDVIGVGVTRTTEYTYNQPMVTGGSIDPKKPGVGISRKDSNTTGTLGLKVYGDVGNERSYYILSCYHVLCSNELGIGITNFCNTNCTNFEVICPSKEDGGKDQILGKVTDGFLSQKLDVAIAKINSSDVLPNIYRQSHAPSGFRTLSDEHIHNQYELYLTGRTSNKQKGILESLYVEEGIEYADGKVRILADLIKTTKIAERGDSGAAVVDHEGKVIGILVATNDIYSYVLPIAQILYELQIKICTI